MVRVRYVVECVVFDDPDKEPRHARVAQVGVRGEGGERSRLTVLQALAALRDGDVLVVEGRGGAAPPAPVVSCECTGYPHLRVDRRGAGAAGAGAGASGAPGLADLPSCE